MPTVSQTLTTRKRWPKFIEAIAATGNVREAARLSGVDRVAAYRKRWREPEFAAKWAEAETLAVELLEDEARRRAHDGIDKPIYHQGRRVDVIKDYSDVLLMFLLKGAKPTKYRDNAAWQQLGADGKPVDPAGPVTITLMSYAGQAPTIEGTAEPAKIE